MRLYLVVFVSVAMLVACGSSENRGDSGAGGITGTAGAIASGGGTIGATGGSRSVDAGNDVAPAKQDCAWLADCISSNNCSDQACAEACVSRSTNVAIVQYSALLDCIDANSQCADSTDCLATACTAEIAACRGGALPSVDAGAPTSSVDAGAANDAPLKADGAALPGLDAGAPDLLPAGLDVAIDRGVVAQGYTTSGSCDIVVKIPNLYDSHTCWDYTLTVTTNHNDGTEHYVAYNSVDVSGTKSACSSQSYSANQPGPWDSAAISASNASHKKQACDLAGSSPSAKSVWTEGGSCGLAASLGHCTDAVTNAWDPATQILSSSLVGAWSTP